MAFETKLKKEDLGRLFSEIEEELKLKKEKRWITIIWFGLRKIQMIIVF